MSGAFPATFTPTFPGSTTTTAGGWNALQAILDEARQTAAAEASAPPVSCPIDGMRLDDVDGILHCPFGNYQFPAGGLSHSGGR